MGSFLCVQVAFANMLKRFAEAKFPSNRVETKECSGHAAYSQQRLPLQETLLSCCHFLSPACKLLKICITRRV